MPTDRALRNHLFELLRGGNAHPGFDEVVRGWPARLQGHKPAGAPHTPWEVLEHMRIAQWDILEFSRNPRHVSPRFPDGYWPPTPKPPGRSAWAASVRAFRRDLGAMQTLVRKPSTDLFAPISHGDGQTILREALLVADHNAYHLGHLMALRRFLGVS